ncbi:MAG: 16S rRNA (cytosine(1402)-N(4))-methyltransferase RsmH [Chthoniobacterales bacterium]
MSDDAPIPHRRRPRYSGKNPRRFEDKYKELNPEKYPDTVAKVIASGKTPAGMHMPIMVGEILDALAPKPGEIVVDCTLGYGGHARELLARIQPGGRLIGLDVDPIEQPRTEQRLRDLGFGPETLIVRRSNFAGLPQALAAENLAGADCILADLGVSSMQIDTPARGFSIKTPGPLDMRMNPNKGQPASAFLERIRPADLAGLLRENADEPRADALAEKLAGQNFALTTQLAHAIRSALPDVSDDERDKSIRRVFQALRIAVNEEFTALDTLLRHLPECLNPGGRAAILTFHSGEDRRVKKSFQAAMREGRYSRIADDVIRPSAAECGTNPRATSAKLRWAVR